MSTSPSRRVGPVFTILIFAVVSVILLFKYFFSGGGHLEIATKIISAINQKSTVNIDSLLLRPSYEGQASHSFDEIDAVFGELSLNSSARNIPYPVGILAIPDGLEPVAAFSICPSYEEVTLHGMSGENGTEGLLRLFYHPVGSGQVCEVNILRKK